MEQKKKSALTREKLLAAAEDLFAESGFAAARVDAIAAQAGVNKQMLYAHFGSKEGIYAAVLARVHERRALRQSEIAKGGFCGPESVRRIVEAYFSFLIEDQNFVRLMLWENLNGARFIRPLESDPYADVKAFLREGIRMGFIREDLDVEETVISLNLFCFSAFSNQHTLSALLGCDLGSKEALAARAGHVGDVFLRYVQKSERA